jgi:hypothetical protein
MPSKAIDYKVYNLKALGGGTDKTLSRQSHNQDMSALDVQSENVLLLQRAANYWHSLQDFRERRERNRRYYRGDQWGDKVWDPDAYEYVTEETLIKSHGKVPLKQNQIRQLIKNLLGQFLTDTSKTSVVSYKREDQTVAEMLTNTIQSGLQVNRSDEIDTRNCEEFLLSGAAVWKSMYKFVDKFQREDLWIENRPVSNMFFTPNLRDTRLTEMDFVGEYHDLYMNDIIAAFAKNPDDEDRIKGMYASTIDPNQIGSTAGQSLSADLADNNKSFYIPTEPDKGRVFEIWERKVGWRLRCHDWLNAKPFVAEHKDKKIIDAENMQRLNDAAMQGADPKLVPLITYKAAYQRYWTVKYLSWQGHVLHQQETPYHHKEHPYTLLLYPLVDGEVWGFVEDIIDQQRYINRLVTLLDFIIGSSAKGVLLVPENVIAPDFDLNRISEEWTKFNGVIKIKLKAGENMQMPEQISANSTNVGIHELLSLQLKFMSEISGVSGPIQGQSAGSGTPASLYAQETQNSTLNSKDYFMAFNAARKERDWKALKVQIQYYDDDRNLALAGAGYNEEALTYQRNRAQGVEFMMAMAKTPDSPVFRALIEDGLTKFLDSGYIDFETYLKNSSLPVANALLSDVQNKRNQLMQGNIGGAGVDPKMLSNVTNYLQGQGADASKADPKAMEMLTRYTKGLDNLN